MAVTSTTGLSSHVNRLVLNQSAAGTTLVAAAAPGMRHKVIGFFFSLAAAGTFRFADGTGNLSGPMDWIADSPASFFSGAEYPLVVTAVNSVLNIVTTGGAARGVIMFTTEPGP